jgi:hypothetical protein
MSHVFKRSQNCWTAGGDSCLCIFPRTIAFVVVLVLSSLAPALRADAPFRRGDVDQTLELDITDAIDIFGYLFLGTFEPACLEAADANDSGEVDISDGIFLLDFLFSGGRAPPPPFPDCGFDPAGNALGCASFPRCVSGRVTTPGGDEAPGSGTLRLYSALDGVELAATPLDSGSFALSVAALPPAGTLCALYLDTAVETDRAMTVFLWPEASAALVIEIRKAFVRFTQSGAPGGFSYAMAGFDALDAGAGAQAILQADATRLELARGIGLELDEGSTLTPAHGGALIAPGGIDIEEGSSLVVTGAARVAFGAPLRVAGSLHARGNSRVVFEGCPPGAPTLVPDGGDFTARFALFKTTTLQVTGASVTRLILSDVIFTEMPAGQGDAYIDLGGLASGPVTLNRLDFQRGTAVPATAARNIRADGCGLQFYVYGYSGVLAGEVFDVDPENAVRWVNNCVPLRVDCDGVISYADTADDALACLPGLLPGQTLTVRANYVNDAGMLVGAAATIVDTLDLGSHAGTLNLDGFTFIGLGGRLLIASSGPGPVHLYNCMLLDLDSGPGRQLVSSLPGVINATFSTLDTTLGASGLALPVNCLFARDPLMAPEPFISYSQRNLRLTKSGHEAVMDGVGLLPAGFERDIDGKLRLDALTSDAGASYFGPDASYAAITALDDVTGGLADMAGGTPAAVTVAFAPSSNFAGGVFYVSSFDGDRCYLSALTRTDITVRHSVQWDGCQSAFPTFQATTDSPTKFWLRVPYDKDGDGTFDTIRKVLHEVGMGFTVNADLGDEGKLYAVDGSPDITSEGGWTTHTYVQLFTATGSSPLQIALTTPKSGGEVHVYYANNLSSDGELYATPDFSPAGRHIAAETYTSGDFALSPHPGIVAQVTGTTGAGVIFIPRLVDGAMWPSSAALIAVPRSAAVTAVTAVDAADILYSLVGPGMNGSLATEPTIATGGPTGERYAASTLESKAYFFTAPDLEGAKVLDFGLTGYGSPLGIYPRGRQSELSVFYPFYNATTCLGAVGAVERRSTQGDVDAYEVLGDAYSDPSLRYCGDGQPGDFDNGIAPTVGQPASPLPLAGSSAVYTGTHAGLVYGWRDRGSLTTPPLGTLLPHFPVRVPWGRVAAVGILTVDDDVLEAKLGLTGPATSFNLVGVWNDTGQVVVFRQP